MEERECPGALLIIKTQVSLVVLRMCEASICAAPVTDMPCAQQSLFAELISILLADSKCLPVAWAVHE
jgi:hypothetical protein